MGWIEHKIGRWVKVILALAVLCPASHAQSTGPDAKIKADVIQRLSTVISERAFVPGVDFGKLGDFLKDQKSEIDAAGTDEEFQRAVNGALKKFGASHVLLLTPRAAQIRRTGSTSGIGISTINSSEGLMIVRVVHGGPADRSGIAEGDVITEVNGKPVSASHGITGEAGTEVQVQIKHPNGKLESLKLVREKYSTVRPPELNWVDKTTAVLRINSFDDGYDRSMIDEMMEDVQDAKNLILDLRYNGGGAVPNLQHLLGMLIPETKPVGAFLRKSTIDNFVQKTGGSATNLSAIAQWTDRKFRPIRQSEAPFFTGKTAVLINRFSASASEIAAAALHDELGSPVIGTKSAGAVLASIIVSAGNGYMIQLPIQDYVTLKGVRLEGNGIKPDFEVPDPIVHRKDSKDLAIEKARQILSQSK